MSDSVAGERLRRLRSAAGALLAGLKPKDQAALITLSHIVQLGAGLTTDLESVRAALDKAQAVGETALVDGIYAGIMVGESDVGRSLLIVFSDGLDTSSWLSPNGVLDIAKRSGVVVYACVDAIAAQTGVPPRSHLVHGRSALRGREDREPRSRLSRSAGGIPAPVSAQLHSPRGGTRRMASTRRPREAKCHGQGTARVSGGVLSSRQEPGRADVYLRRTASSLLACHALAARTTGCQEVVHDRP